MGKIEPSTWNALSQKMPLTLPTGFRATGQAAKNAKSTLDEIVLNAGHDEGKAVIANGLKSVLSLVTFVSCRSYKFLGDYAGIFSRAYSYIRGNPQEKAMQGYYCLKEVSERIGIAYDRVWWAAATGRVQTERVGRTRLFTDEHVEILKKHFAALEKRQDQKACSQAEGIAGSRQEQRICTLPSITGRKDKSKR